MKTILKCIVLDEIRVFLCKSTQRFYLDPLLFFQKRHFLFNTTESFPKRVRTWQEFLGNLCNGRKRKAFLCNGRIWYVFDFGRGSKLLFVFMIMLHIIRITARNTNTNFFSVLCTK